MFPNEKARLMRMMDSHGVPAVNKSGTKMDFTQRVTWLIEHANQQSVQRTCPNCGGEKYVERLDGTRVNCEVCGGTGTSR